MSFESFISYFDVRQRTRNGVKALCPAHADKEASLSITRASRGKGVLLYCHAGCKYKDIIKAAEIPLSVLYDDDDTMGSFKVIKEEHGSFWQSFRNWEDWLQKDCGKTIEARYDYYDVNGSYAFTRFRLYPKDFRYGIFDESRGYRNFMSGLDGRTRRSIPAIFTVNFQKFKDAVAAGKRIFYVEGEKDVCTLHKHGHIAFTCGSAKDWIPACASLCEGADLVILADNDTPGMNLARNVQKAAGGRIMVPCPNIKGGDVSDFFKEHTDDEFERFLNEGRCY